MGILKNISQKISNAFNTKPILANESWTDAGIEKGDKQYVGDLIDRTMSYTEQEEQANHAFKYYKKNPLAHGIINVICRFCIQQGVSYHSENQAVMDAIKSFWTDTDNQFDKKAVQEQILRDALLGGELIFPVFTSKQMGRVKLGQLDTNSIYNVVRDKDNPAKLSSVHTNYRRGANRIIYKIINSDYNNESEDRCFLFQLNRFKSSTRGWGILTPALDFLDIYDMLLWGMGERLELQSRYIKDVTLTGATPEECIDYVKKHTNVKPGAMTVHNENTEIKFPAPNLPSGDYDTAVNLIKQSILSALGLPEHWFGNIGSGNRATAADTTKSATMNIEAFQNFFVGVLKELTDYQLHEYVKKGTYKGITEKDIEDYTLIPPQLFIDDYSAIIAGLLSLSISLQNAEGAGFIDQSEAAYVYRYAITQLGIDLQDAPKMEFDEKPKSEPTDEVDVVDDIKTTDDKKDIPTTKEKFYSGMLKDDYTKTLLEKAGIV